MRHHTGRHRNDPILALTNSVLPDHCDLRIWTQESLDKAFILHFQPQMVSHGVNMSEHIEIGHLLSHPLLKLLNQIKQGMLPEK